MTVSQLKRLCEELERAGRGADRVYTDDGSELSPVYATELRADPDCPAVILDLTAAPLDD